MTIYVEKIIKLLLRWQVYSQTNKKHKIKHVLIFFSFEIILFSCSETQSRNERTDHTRLK